MLNGPNHLRRWRLLLLLAVAAFSLACKSSTDAPPDNAAGAGGAANEPGEGDAGATGTQGGADGNPGEGEGGNVSMPGAGGVPTEPGSWDESFWDKAVWQ